MKKYIKRERVIDVTDLPGGVRDAVYNIWTGDGYSNGSYRRWSVGDSEEYDEEDENVKRFDTFLKEQGLKNGNDVIVLLWW